MAHIVRHFVRRLREGYWRRARVLPSSLDKTALSDSTAVVFTAGVRPALTLTG